MFAILGAISPYRSFRMHTAREATRALPDALLLNSIASGLQNSVNKNGDHLTRTLLSQQNMPTFKSVRGEKTRKGSQIPLFPQHIHFMPRDLIQSPGITFSSTSHYQPQESPAPLAEGRAGSKGTGLPRLPTLTFPEAACHLQGKCHQRWTHKHIQ